MMTMTRGDFFTRPSDFGFELNPLDVNIAKMQHQLLERIKEVESKDDIPPLPMRETYVSRNPEKEYGDITLEISKDKDSLTGLMYMVKIIVKSKTGNLSTEMMLYQGYWDNLKLFVNGDIRVWGGKWDFFSLCKANALWLDYQVRTDIEEKREKAIEDDLAQEDGSGLNILVCIDSGCQEGQWPTPALKQILPQSDILSPKLPVVGRDASAVVNEILGNHPDINIVITGKLNDYYNPNLSSFNVCKVRPSHPLSELGEYVCHEAIELNIYYRKDADSSLQYRVENRLSIFAKRILDERVERYNHEGGEYEQVADTAILLYVMLVPKLPKVGELENKLEETQTVRIKEKKFELTMTISPLKERKVSVRVELKHEMIRDHTCFSEFGMIDDLGRLLTSREGMYKIYSSVQSLMASWPTPLEMKLKEAKLIDTDEFWVESNDDAQIVRLSKNCALHIMEHTFHGIEEIMSWKGERPVILERSKLFPCFDSYDYANENRFYRHFLFCKDNADADDKRKDFDAIPRGYGCLIDRRYPEYLRPLVFYSDESDTMTLLY